MPRGHPLYSTERWLKLYKYEKQMQQSSIGDVVSLKDVCLLTVGNYLSPSNVWSIYRLVPYVHCKRIEHVVHSFICDHFMDISHTDQFLALDEKEMQWLVDNHDIVASEAAVLHGLARWYKHSEHQRENAFKQLFDRLHVSVIGKDVLWEVIKKYELHKVIPDLLKYKVSKFLAHRVNIDKLIYQENLSNIAVFEKSNLQWNPEQGSLLFKYWMPLASRLIDSDQSLDVNEFDYVIPYRDNIFMFGMVKGEGMGEASPVPVFIRVNLQYQSITHCTPLVKILGMSPRTRCLTVSCGMYIYFLGGHDIGKPHTPVSDVYALRTAYRYDIVKDEWREMAPMNHGHFSSHNCAVAYDRYLYVIGNVNCEKYDMLRNSWTKIVPPMPFDERWRCYASCFTMNNKIYATTWIACSTHVLKHVFSLDPSLTESWEFFKIKHNVEPCCFPCCYFGEYFFLVSQTPQTPSTELHFSVVDKMLGEKKRLVSMKGLGFHDAHMMVLNRGARSHIEQNKLAVSIHQ